MAPFDRILSAPGEVMKVIGLLRNIASNTEQMAETMERMDGRIAEVAEATQSLPKIHAHMAEVAAATEILPEMHDRMGTIAGAMPVLVDVQKSLVRMPQTVERLDAGLAELAEVLDKMLIALQALDGHIDLLYSSMGPLSRLAQRFGGRERERE